MRHATIVVAMAFILFSSPRHCHAANSTSAPLDSAVVDFVSAQTGHGISYDDAHTFGESALGTLQTLLGDDSWKNTWENAIATVGAIGSPRGVSILQAFMWRRFQGQVDDSTFRALRNVPIALGLISNGGEVEATTFLELGTNPAYWDSLAWSDRFYSRQELGVFLATVYVVGLSYSGSERARRTLTRLAQSPHSKQQKEVAMAAIQRNEKIRQQGLREFLRQERLKRGW